jgi:hypothetical protein
MSNSKNKRRHAQKLLQVAVCNFLSNGIRCKNTEVSQKKGKTAVKQPLGSYDWVFFILWNKPNENIYPEKNKIHATKQTKPSKRQ